MPDDDGPKRFNFRYLKVTEKVLENPPAGDWSLPVRPARLDVVLAGLYFDALGGVGQRRGRPDNILALCEVAAAGGTIVVERRGFTESQLSFLCAG